MFLASRSGDKWVLRGFPNRRQSRWQIRKFFRQYPASEYDLYLCPNSFRTDKLAKSTALSTPYAWSDIDLGDPEGFDPPTPILWESSPNRFQGLWIFDRRLSPGEAEGISRHYAHDFGADRSGWPITKLLRIPGSTNHKVEYNRPQVRLIRADWTPHPSESLASTHGHRLEKHLTIIPANTLSAAVARDPRLLLRGLRREISHPKVISLLRDKRLYERDRSGAIYFMTTTMLNDGLREADIACMVFHSVYWQSKHGGDINALAAEIARCKAKLGVKK